MRLIRSVAIAALMLGTGEQARALTFNFSVVSGDTLTSAQSAAFTAAASAWSATVTDNFTVTLQIGFRSLATGVLGQTSASLVQGSASAIRTALVADAKSADDVAAVASLANATGQLLVTTAQSKALGLGSSGSDGTIEFSSSFSFSTSRDGNGTIAGGTYDLIGIAEHEIGHVLGFISAVDGLPSPTLLDEFRYGSASNRSLTAGQNAYFSIDGGITDINNFAIGGSGNAQASHWITGTGALMDPAIAAGNTQNITALDRRAFDVIGYDLATNVPEPATLALLLPFVLAAVRSRRQV